MCRCVHALWDVIVLIRRTYMHGGIGRGEETGLVYPWRDTWTPRLRETPGNHSWFEGASHGRDWIRIRSEAHRENGEYIPLCNYLKFDRTISKIKKGVSGARADNTKILKGTVLDWIVPKWEALTPPLPRNVKINWGFNHERTGRLLCPVELDWADPEWVASTIIRSGPYLVLRLIQNKVSITFRRVTCTWGPMASSGICQSQLQRNRTMGSHQQILGHFGF